MIKINENSYIECGDCLELMKNLPSNFVDIYFTSPPYNDTGSAKQNVAEADSGGCNHKKYLFVENRKDWFEWMCSIIDEMRRVSKKYVLLNVQALKKNRENVYKLIGHYSKHIHDILIWYKPNGLPTSTPHKISNTYEFLIIIKCEGVKGVNVNSNFYRNVIVKNNNSNKKYAKVHRAVMSKEFCEEIIKEFTEENDIVLDPFNGLGTTTLCCYEQKRKFIGMDICQEYCNIAAQRIKEVQNDLQK